MGGKPLRKGWIKILLLFRHKQAVANCSYSMSPGLPGGMSSTGQGGHAPVWLVTALCHPESLGKYDMFKLEASTAQIFLKYLNLPDEMHIYCLSPCLYMASHHVCSTHLSSHGEAVGSMIRRGQGLHDLPQLGLCLRGIDMP